LRRRRVSDFLERQLSYAGTNRTRFKGYFLSPRFLGAPLAVFQPSLASPHGLREHQPGLPWPGVQRREQTLSLFAKTPPHPLAVFQPSLASPHGLREHQPGLPWPGVQRREQTLSLFAKTPPHPLAVFQPSLASPHGLREHQPGLPWPGVQRREQTLSLFAWRLLHH